MDYTLDRTIKNPFNPTICCLRFARKIFIYIPNQFSHSGTHCLQPPLPNDTLGLKLYEWQRGEPVLIGDVRQNECYVSKNFLYMLYFDLQEVKYICRDGAALAGGQVQNSKV